MQQAKRAKKQWTTQWAMRWTKTSLRTKLFVSYLALVLIGVATVYPNTPAEVYEDLEAPALYFRVAGVGRGGPIRTEKLEDLAALAEHYQAIALTIAFASVARWQDARNFKKLLGEVSAEADLQDPGE